MRRIGELVLLCVVIAACNDGERPDAARVDAAQLYSSSGEVALTDGSSLEFSITSERYKQWYTAQQGLDRRIATRFGAILQPASPSERSIDRAVQYLQTEPRARAAIARAGLSVREFVVTTVALEQEMRVASTSGMRPADTMPLPIPYPYPLDSTYTPAYPPPPSPYPPNYTPPYPAPYPPGYPQPYPATPPAYPALPPRRVDSLPKIDSMLPGRDTIRRDTLPTRRDTIWPRRDTAWPRRDSQPPRDSVQPRRDTLRPKRDTIVRRDTASRNQ